VFKKLDLEKFRKIWSDLINLGQDLGPFLATIVEEDGEKTLAY
jgi:hypothetical protein